jgi:hypothetical protein
MTLTKDHGDGRIRTFGAVWIMLAPVVFLMAAISTVQSEVTYRVQLAAFSAVALAGVILGVAGLLGRSWAAVGLLVLSLLGAAYFFGAALLILVWPLVPGSAAEFNAVVMLVPLMIAPFGVPFLLMARSLRRIVRQRRTDVGPGEA